MTSTILLYLVGVGIENASSEVNKDDLNEEELEAFTKLEEVMNKIKYNK